MLFTDSLQLGEEENKNVFGKCNNPNGHGHNYKGIWIFLNQLEFKTNYSVPSRYLPYLYIQFHLHTIYMFDVLVYRFNRLYCCFKILLISEKKNIDEVDIRDQ